MGCLHELGEPEEGVGEGVVQHVGVQVVLAHSIIIGSIIDMFKKRNPSSKTTNIASILTGIDAQPHQHQSGPDEALPVRANREGLVGMEGPADESMHQEAIPAMELAS